MSDRDEVVGQNVARMRGERTQQEVADAMRAAGYKWSQATVWAVEKGERPLRLTEAEDMVRNLGGQLSDLILPPTEASIIEMLNRFMAEIQKIRKGFAFNMEMLQETQTALAASVEFAEEALETDEIDSHSKVKITRLVGVAKEVLSWTPESVVRGLRDDG